MSQVLKIQHSVTQAGETLTCHTIGALRGHTEKRNRQAGPEPICQLALDGTERDSAQLKHFGTLRCSLNSTVSIRTAMSGSTEFISACAPMATSHLLMTSRRI